MTAISTRSTTTTHTLILRESQTLTQRPFTPLTSVVYFIAAPVTTLGPYVKTCLVPMLKQQLPMTAVFITQMCTHVHHL